MSFYTAEHSLNNASSASREIRSVSPPFNDVLGQSSDTRRADQGSDGRSSTIHVQQLPQDLKFEILARLPVKLLVRSKSVSKEWYVLISNPDFAKLHLQYHSTRRDLQLFISTRNKLATMELQRSDVDMIYKDWFSLACLGLKINLDTWDSKLDVESGAIAGSSNGLICYVIGTQLKDLCLCNPATREQHLIAGPPTSYIALRWGFGYDSSSNDYKTVLVGKFVAHIFSLKTNRWRGLPLDINLPLSQNDYYDDKAAHIRRYPIPVQVGNTLNWLVDPDPKDRIVDILAFDLTSEQFSILPPLPPPKDLGTGVNVEEPTYYFLSEFNQCLCACLFYQGRKAFSMKGWMLDDQKTWKSFLNIRRLKTGFRNANRVYPKLFTLKDGSNKVFIFERSLSSISVCDPQGGFYLLPKIVHLVNRNSKSMYFANYLLSYTQSLVSPSFWTTAAKTRKEKTA